MRTIIKDSIMVDYTTISRPEDRGNPINGWNFACIARIEIKGRKEGRNEARCRKEEW